MMIVLVDSGFLYELYDQSAPRYERTNKWAKGYHGRSLVPDVVLVEAAFLFFKAGGIPAILMFLDRLIAAQTELIHVTLADLQRAREIMAKYQSAEFDLVDCCIMALSERLKITRVCTYDCVDFSMFRPKHCDYLELLP